MYVCTVQHKTLVVKTLVDLADETSFVNVVSANFLTTENMEQIEDILQGMCPTTVKLATIATEPS